MNTQQIVFALLDVNLLAEQQTDLIAPFLRIFEVFRFEGRGDKSDRVTKLKHTEYVLIPKWLKHVTCDLNRIQYKTLSFFNHGGWKIIISLPKYRSSSRQK